MSEDEKYNRLKEAFLELLKLSLSFVDEDKREVVENEWMVSAALDEK